MMLLSYIVVLAIDSFGLFFSKKVSKMPYLNILSNIYSKLVLNIDNYLKEV